jgi:hypothetical protein
MRAANVAFMRSDVALAWFAANRRKILVALTLFVLSEVVAWRRARNGRAWRGSPCPVSSSGGW